jgi:hypothetical protein
MSAGKETPEGATFEGKEKQAKSNNPKKVTAKGASKQGRPPRVPSQGRLEQPGIRIDFRAVNRAALVRLPTLLKQWLPHGVLQGDEYTALNPTRVDRRLGSFRINVSIGRWADFATGDKGGDVISLLAYLDGISQVKAAQRLEAMLGLRHD